MSIRQRLQSGEVLVLDGAIGTELESRGIPLVHDGSWAECLGTNPETVRQVHDDYVRAGADIITTNTYASGRSVLRKIGHESEFEAWNRTAVELALSARDSVAGSREVYVAGSISAYGNGAMRYQGTADSIQWGESDGELIRRNFRDQISLLIEAGIDLVMLEMVGAEQLDIQTAIDASTDFDVPVCLSLSCTVDPETDMLCLQLTDGTGARPEKAGFDEVLGSVQGCDLLALLTHHIEIDLVDRALGEMREGWGGVIGVYPNRTGHWDGAKWVFADEVTPEAYAIQARSWAAQGAQIIGGCCGVRPAHIAAVSSELKID